MVKYWVLRNLFISDYFLELMFDMEMKTLYAFHVLIQNNVHVKYAVDAFFMVGDIVLQGLKLNPVSSWCQVEQSTPCQRPYKCL